MNYNSWLKKKLRKHRKKGRKTSGLKKELSFLSGNIVRPKFVTGRAARAIDEAQRKKTRPTSEK